MTEWTDAGFQAVFRSLDAPADPGGEFADRLFEHLLGALDRAEATEPVVERAGPTPDPDAESEAAVIPSLPDALGRRRTNGRWWLLRVAAVAALVMGAAIGVSRWRSDGTQSLTAAVPANLVGLDDHCHNALPAVGSAISELDVPTASGYGPFSTDKLRVVITVIDQFTTAALVVAPEDLPSSIRNPLEQAQATAASALRALDDGGPDSALRARDAQYAAREALAGALRIAATDGAAACRPTW
jgi:hypothetical protein